MMMIREMSTEQLDTLVIGKHVRFSQQHDWSQLWPLVDSQGIVREIVDGTEGAPEYAVFDEANDCYRYASEFPELCEAEED
jgi:hypothetical protein